MEPIQVGILSLLPPLVAIVLALVTKEVISSLSVGIITGTLIYSLSTGGGIIKTIEIIFSLMAQKIGDNAYIIIFLSLLGALVVVITKAGGSLAYGDKMSKKIRTRSRAQIFTTFLGILIFIDDYFNCLTVGTVMRPITDKQKVSRAKLAYILHSMAASICMLTPISSWAASIISYMDGTDLNGMSAFLQSIQYNLYPILTIIMVFIMAIPGADFGPMAEFEKRAIESDDVIEDESGFDDDELANIKQSPNGKVYDLVVPILSLILFSLFEMLNLGGFFSGEGVTIIQAFANTDAAESITFGAFAALIVAFLMFVPRKLLSFKDFISGIGQGMKTMVAAFIILTLAWTIGEICRSLLNTGDYLGHLFTSSNAPAFLLPAIIFIISGILAFAMGTAWGTFGILIPIVAMVCQRVAPDLTIICLSAVLSGAVLGDHGSPISDITILASTGASCNYIDHITTQLPYSIFVAVISLLGFILAGITANIFVTMGFSVAFLFIGIWLCSRLYKRRRVRA